MFKTYDNTAQLGNRMHSNGVLSEWPWCVVLEMHLYPSDGCLPNSKSLPHSPYTRPLETFCYVSLAQQCTCLCSIHTERGLVPLSFKNSLFELPWITAKRKGKKTPTHLCTLLEWVEKFYDTVIVSGGSMAAQGTTVFFFPFLFRFISFWRWEARWLEISIYLIEPPQLIEARGCRRTWWNIFYFLLIFLGL